MIEGAITRAGAKGLAGEIPGKVYYGMQGPPGPVGPIGKNGEDGGYYTPVVTQPDEDTIQFEFTPSKEGMPAVDPVTVELPAGQGSGGNVAYDEAQNLTNEQKAQARENIGAQPTGNYLTEVPEGYAKTEDIPSLDGYAKTEDVPTDAKIIQLIKDNTPEPSGGSIAVTGATVGQTVKISAVDENGVPTAWESVDFPSGGGGSAENDNDWEIINELTIGEEGITSFLFDKDKNGNPFELSDVKLISGYQSSLGGTWDSGARTILVINGKEVAVIGGLSMAERYFIVIAFLINGRIYEGDSNGFSQATQSYHSVNIRALEKLNANSITSIGVRINNLETGYFAVGYRLTLWGRRKK